MSTFEDFKERFKRAKDRGVDTKTLFMLEQFETAIASDPNDAQAYATMGDFLFRQRQYRQALDHLQRALQIDSKCVPALCAHSRLRATCPDGFFREGNLAVHDAEAAIAIAGSHGQLKRDWKHRSYLQMLAAAYAEQGDFAAAISTIQEALSMAITKLATRELAGDLESYNQGKPRRS